MQDAEVKYFFSDDADDMRGVQFARAMEDEKKLAEFVKAKNYTNYHSDYKGLHDDDVHPEVISFVAQVGAYHRTIMVDTLDKLTTLNIVKNVLKKWNSLHITVKNFYNSYMNLVDLNDTFIIQPQNVQEHKGFPLSAFTQIKETDYSHFRLNLLRIDQPQMPSLANPFGQQQQPLPQGQPSRTKFQVILFDIPVAPNVIGLALAVPSPQNFGTLDDVYTAPPQSIALRTLPNSSPKLGFGIEKNKFVLDAIQRSISGQKDEMDAGPSVSLLDFATRNIIQFENGKFVFKVHGVTTPIEVGEANCWGTKINGAYCNDFISNIIMKQDAQAFKDYFGNNFSDSAFVDLEQTDFAQMNPQMSVAILKRFGFEIIDGLVELYPNWYARFKTANPAVFAKIENAPKLRLYLRHLVEFVNNNKTVLQDHTPASTTVDPNSTLGKYGVKRIPRILLDVDNSKDKAGALLQIQAHYNTYQSLMPYGAPYPFMTQRFPHMPGMLAGGDKPVGDSALMRSMIFGLIDDLNRKGKKISSADKATIEEHLRMYDQLGASLSNVSLQLNTYKDWIALFPRKDEQTNMDGIAATLKEYEECAKKHALIGSGLVKVAQCLSQKCV